MADKQSTSKSKSGTTAKAVKSAATTESGFKGRSKMSGDQAKKMKELEEKNASLKLSLDSIQQERDFYFAKLRDCEVICTNSTFESNPVSNNTGFITPFQSY